LTKPNLTDLNLTKLKQTDFDSRASSSSPDKMADNHIAQTLTILMQSVQQLVQLQQQHTLTQSVQQLTGQQLTQIDSAVGPGAARATYLSSEHHPGSQNACSQGA
jgi:hypothetical protein